MTSIVTLEEALVHLRLDQEGSPNPYAEDVTAKIAHASALVFTHIKRLPEDDIEQAVLKAATLKVVGNLYRYRGDEDTRGVSGALQGPMTPDIIAMLSMMRDPALA